MLAAVLLAAIAYLLFLIAAETIFLFTGFAITIISLSSLTIIYRHKKGRNGPIQDEYIRLDVEVLKGLIEGMGFFVVIFLLSEETKASVYLVEIIGLTVLLLLLLVNRKPVTYVRYSSEGLSYRRYLKPKITINHSWDEVVQSKINQSIIYLKFSNGDTFKIPGTNTEIGRKVAEAYESYSSGDSEA